MDSESVHLPSTVDISSSTPLQNGHLSPMTDRVSNIDEANMSSESELSDVERPSPPRSLSSEQDQDSRPESRMSDEMDIDGGSDEDAEGDEDGDYDIETPPTANAATGRAERSSSGSSAGSLKRKSSGDEDTYIRDNPELYGLRRSGRARPSRRVVESSSEDDDDEEPRRKRRKTNSVPKTSSRNTPVQNSTPPSDSDSDAFATSRRRAGVAKKKRRLQGNGTLAPPPSRFSERRTAKVTNYNEDDGFSDDEEMVTPDNWTYEVDENTPAIETVMDAKPKDGLEGKSELGKHDYLYWVRWQGQAYYHATWETWDTLINCKGYRRLENFWREFSYFKNSLADPDYPAEEKEIVCITREDKLDAFKERMHIDRIFGARRGEEETEYHVLWKACEYADSTWEPASLVSKLAQEAIDRYLDRSSHLPVTDRKEANPATRSRYQRFREQPDYIKHGQLRDFQITGVNFLAHSWSRDDNVILADEMGLGKTVQTIAFINWLRHERGQQGPYLVVAPLSTLPAWAETFDKWSPDINYIKYTGGKESRKIIHDHEMFVPGKTQKYKFNVLLTTYEFIIKDSTFLGTIKWQHVAVDEAHRLKNRDSALYEILMDWKIPSRLLITGTPMQNNYTELAALMNFLKPGQGDVADKAAADDVTAQTVIQLRSAINSLLMRRTKKQVEKDLPPKSEKIIRIALSDYQLEYYKNILAKNYTALNQGSNGQKASLLNITMELKKCSNHAFMLTNAEDRRMEGVSPNDRNEQLKAVVTCSGKMIVLEKLLTKLKAEGHRVLIFSQMVKMLDILGEYCRLKGEKFQRLDGTIGAGPRNQAINHFNAPDSQDFIFLLSTRAGGLGINLTSADTIIIWDSDWNPQADLQAMARAHRIGQTKPVQVFRFVSKDTIEEDILERARNKIILEYLTIQQGLSDSDNKTVEKRFSREYKDAGEPDTVEAINNLLKRRGQRMFEQTGNQKELESMDIDNVIASAEERQTEQDEDDGGDGNPDFMKAFDYTDVVADLEWDNIIPEDQLQKIKEDARKAEEERLTRELLEQAEPRKRKALNDGHEARDQRAARRPARPATATADDDSDEESEADLDPKRPLSMREVRNLIRAYEKHGSIDDRQEEFLRDSKLQGRDIDVIKASLAKIVNEAQRLVDDADEKLRQQERNSDKPLTKKERKAILFNHGDVKRLNAETILQRPQEMRMVREVVANTHDWRNFRIPEASKGAQYSCDWGAREDGMLIVGIARYGYGAWVAIRDDPELAMSNRFFLEEHRVDRKAEREGNKEDRHAKSPGAVHLVRRANYLIQVLKDKTSGGTNIAVKKALENHHRNNKKSLMQRPEKSATSSPAPGNMRKMPSTDSIHRPRGISHSESRQHFSSSFSDRKGTPDRRINGVNGTPDRKRKAEDDGDDERKPKPKHARSDEQLNAIKIHKRSQAHKDRASESHRRQSLETKNSKSKSASRPPPTPQPPSPDEFRNKHYQPLKELRGCTQKNFPDKQTYGRELIHKILEVGKAINEEMKKSRASSDSVLWDMVATRYWPKPDPTVTGTKVKAQFMKYYEKYLEKEKEKEKEGKEKEAKLSGGETGAKATNGIHTNGGAAKTAANTNT